MKPDAVMVVLLAGAAGLHARARRAAAATPLLSGRDAGLRPGGRAGDEARALHRRLRRSGGAARPTLSRRARCIRLPDPAHALRERRAGQDLDQLLPRRLDHASPTRLAELCERIGADWSEIAPALKLDRRIGPYAYLTPGPRHRRRQSRARPRHGAAPVATPTAPRRAWSRPGCATAGTAGIGRCGNCMNASCRESASPSSAFWA